MERTFKVGEDEYNLVYLRNEEALKFCLDPSNYFSNEVIGFDIETTHRDKYKGHHDAGLLPKKTRIRTLQFFDGDTAVVLDLFHVRDGYIIAQEKYKEHVTRLCEYFYEVKLIAHNSLFELSHLQNFMSALGLYKKPLEIPCTMNMFSLIMQAQTHEWRKYSRSLANVSKMLLDLDVGKETQRSDWSSRVLTQEQIEYAAGDAVLARDIMFALAPKLKELGLVECFKRNTRAQGPISTMRVNGIGTDYKLHSEMIESWKQEAFRFKTELGSKLNAGIEETIEAGYGTVRQLLLYKVVSSQHTKLLEFLEYKGEDSWTYEKVQATVDELQEEQARDYYNVDMKDKSPEAREKKRFRRALRRCLKNLKSVIVDPGSSKQMSDWLETELDDHILQSWPRTGDPEPTEEADQEYTGNGYLKTDAPTLHLHRDLEVVKPLLGYKKLAKKVSTYGSKLADWYVGEEGRRIVYPSYSLCYTHTGRMSSFAPNLQNMPADPEFRDIFVAKGEEGQRSLLVCDFSQIETRVAAYVSKEPGLIEVYEKGLDVYSATAARMFNLPLEECGKGTIQRKLGKIAVLSLLFGSGPKRLREQAKGPMYNLDMTLEEAQDIVDKFRAAYPTLRDWQVMVSNQAKDDLVSYTRGGKIRALDPDMSYTTSMNTPVQGTAWDIMSEAMIAIDTKVLEEGLDAHLVNVVHDEVILDCAVEAIERTSEIVKKAFEDSLLLFFPGQTTLKLAKPEAVYRWGQADK